MLHFTASAGPGVAPRGFDTRQGSGACRIRPGALAPFYAEIVDLSHQTENGYTRIADTLLDAIARADLSKREYKILLVVIRRTYGFSRKTAPLSATFIALATGLDRAHIARTVSAMVQRGILTREHTQHANLLGINKGWFRVEASAKTALAGGAETATVASAKTAAPTVAETATQVLPKQPHKRETSIDTSIDTPLPPGLDPQVWQEFKQHRKEKRAKFTPTAERRALLMLAKQSDPTACVVQSLEAGWQGIFPLKTNGVNRNGNGRHRPDYDQLIRDADEAAAEAEAAAGDDPVVATHGRDLRRQPLG